MNDPNFIKKVEILGLWNRLDISWELNFDVNILAGINGSGKTTILDLVCALIAFGKIPDSYQGAAHSIKITFDNDNHISYKYIKEKDVKIVNLERKAKNDPIYKQIISDIKDEKGSEYRKIKSVSFETHTVALENLKMKLDDLHKIINLDIISTFDTPLKSLEDVRKIVDENITTELDRKIYILQKEYLDYQLNLVRKIEACATENIHEEINKIKHQKDRFIEIINCIYSKTGKKIDVNKNEIEFLIDGKNIKPFKLSSGEKQILIILLTTLLQDGKQSILFMDEPEISLHLDWQRKLIGYIRELNPNVQIIMSTHSPGIIIEGWQDKVFEVSDISKKSN
jgi:predicted ATPase